MGSGSVSISKSRPRHRSRPSSRSSPCFSTSAGIRHWLLTGPELAPSLPRERSRPALKGTLHGHCGRLFDRSVHSRPRHTTDGDDDGQIWAPILATGSSQAHSWLQASQGRDPGLPGKARSMAIAEGSVTDLCTLDPGIRPITMMVYKSGRR